MALVPGAYIANEITMAQIIQRARSIPRILTNPATYKQGELDMPEMSEFWD